MEERSHNEDNGRKSKDGGRCIAGRENSFLGSEGLHVSLPFSKVGVMFASLCTCALLHLTGHNVNM